MMGASPGKSVEPLVVGARGWAHPAWSEHYYPHDLPEDWRLAYYANEFSGVLVPAGYLAGDGEPGDVARPAQWYDDVTDGFHFFVELRWPWLTQASGSAAWRQALSALGERLSGVIVTLPQPAPSPDALADGLAALEGGASVHVDFGPDASVSEAHRSVVTGHGARLCWRSGAVAPGGGYVGLVRIEDSRHNVRALREVMERFVAWVEAQSPAFLFLEGEPPGIQRLQEAVTLRDLMGL